MIWISTVWSKITQDLKGFYNININRYATLFAKKRIKALNLVAENVKPQQGEGYHWSATTMT